MYVKDTIITVSLFAPSQLSFQARKCKEIYLICISVLSLILKKKVRLRSFSSQFVKFISQFQYSSCDMSSSEV